MGGKRERRHCVYGDGYRGRGRLQRRRGGFAGVVRVCLSVSCVCCGFPLPVSGHFCVCVGLLPIVGTSNPTLKKEREKNRHLHKTKKTKNLHAWREMGSACWAFCFALCCWVPLRMEHVGHNGFSTARRPTSHPQTQMPPPPSSTLIWAPMIPLTTRTIDFDVF